MVQKVMETVWSVERYWLEVYCSNYYVLVDMVLNVEHH